MRLAPAFVETLLNSHIASSAWALEVSVKEETEKKRNEKRECMDSFELKYTIHVQRYGSLTRLFSWADWDSDFYNLGN
jgi:hypothetical protein